MQTLELFCVYDLKAEFYGSPFTARNAAVGKRIFERLCLSGESEISKAPSDYTLVRVGFFNDADASITVCNPVTVCSGAQVVLEYTRGAAVGGESPLKPQSAINSVSEVDAGTSTPACEASEISSSKAN